VKQVIREQGNVNRRDVSKIRKFFFSIAQLCKTSGVFGWQRILQCCIRIPHSHGGSKHEQALPPRPARAQSFCGNSSGTQFERRFNFIEARKTSRRIASARLLDLSVFYTSPVRGEHQNHTALK
jgi:hypothetical protein